MNENQKEVINSLNELKTRQQLEEELEFLKKVQNTPKIKRRYEIFGKQCRINEILEKIIKYVNSKSSNEKVTPYNNTILGNIVSKQEIDTFIEENNIFELDEDVDVTLLNMNEIRNYLYKIYELEPVPVPVENEKREMNIIELYAAGLNPDGLYKEGNKYYMDEEDYKKAGIYNDYILNGEIFGKKIAKHINKSKK